MSGPSLEEKKLFRIEEMKSIKQLLKVSEVD